MKFVLASKSPRRKELLSLFDLRLIITSHLFDESSISTEIPPKEYCELVAKGKALSIRNNYLEYPIISADTIVVIDNKILGKPKDLYEASEMLNLLSARKHQVFTGVNIIYNKYDINFHFVERTTVEFNKLNQNDISYYLNRYKPFDKSGSYGIQDFSSIFIKSINGCFFNVMGLPLSRLFYYLKEFELIEFSLKT